MNKGSNKATPPLLHKPTFHSLPTPQDLAYLFLREKKNHHSEAATAAFNYADQLEQLSRPVGRSAEVWLGRAAVAADMGRPDAALDDLELALAQLRKNAKVSRKAGGKRHPPQVGRPTTGGRRIVRWTRSLTGGNVLSTQGRE